LACQSRHCLRARHLTFGVTGRSGDTKPYARTVALVGIERELADLRRFAEAQWQYAGSHRVESTGMPGLLSRELSLDDLQQLVGSHAGRLVHDQDAVQPPAALLYHVYSTRLQKAAIIRIQAAPVIRTKRRVKLYRPAPLSRNSPRPRTVSSTRYTRLPVSPV